jgi:hypothetical protein
MDERREAELTDSAKEDQSRLEIRGWLRQRAAQDEDGPRTGGHPEAGQTNVGTPFSGDGTAVSVRILGDDMFRIESPVATRDVRGYKLACVVAREMAGKLIQNGREVAPQRRDSLDELL